MRKFGLKLDIKEISQKQVPNNNTNLVTIVIVRRRRKQKTSQFDHIPLTDSEQQMD